MILTLVWNAFIVFKIVKEIVTRFYVDRHKLPSIESEMISNFN